MLSLAHNAPPGKLSMLKSLKMRCIHSNEMDDADTIGLELGGQYHNLLLDHTPAGSVE